jgi:tRNA C32,U32 (ribose-2'-O)-methylase TrmJ
MNPINRYVQIVLVETSHPGNIGSVARAMKNMGLANLSLINPKKVSTSRSNGSCWQRN